MSAMLMGAPSQMDDVFLPTSFTPASLARELREDMKHDMTHPLLHTPPSPHHHHHHHFHHNHNRPSEGTFDERRGGGDDGNDDDKEYDEERLIPTPTTSTQQTPSPTSTRILVDALVTDPTPTTRWYQAWLLTSLMTLLVLAGVALGRGYVRHVLGWLQGQSPLVGAAIFSTLFLLVSFPVCWGYGMLLLAAGYLYGCVKGPLLALTATALSLTVANAVMRSCCRNYLMGRLYSDKVKAIVHVLNSAQGLKIVALTRLTPIPFGLQNALFSFSDMRTTRYMLASLAGLCPMTALYSYMGSTLRSMEDVLSSPANRASAYLILGGQMVLTGVLAVFVVRKARGELRKAMEQSTAPTPLSSCDVME